MDTRDGRRTVSIILDAGALIGVDRGVPTVIRHLELQRRSGDYLRTPAPVLAQVWRDGSRQARLAQFMRHVDVLTVDEAQAKAAGVLCARSGISDAVDALVALAARSGDTVVTSDPHDLTRATEALGYPVSIVEV